MKEDQILFTNAEVLLHGAIPFSQTALVFTFSSGGRLLFCEMPERKIVMEGPVPSRAEIAEVMADAGWHGQGLLDCMMLVAETVKKD